MDFLIVLILTILDLFEQYIDLGFVCKYSYAYIWRPMKIGIFRLLTFFIFLSVPTVSWSQNAKVYGVISDSLNNPIEAVSISVLGSAAGISSNRKGEFELTIPANEPVTVAFSFIGFETKFFKMNLKPGEQKELNLDMKSKTQSIRTIVVEDRIGQATTMTRLNPKLAQRVPSPSGNFEGLLFTLPGVSSNNELSSTYNVRGGNFDENLIYVNDIEIYRPFLIRSGQQEGLSFVNSNLVQSVEFSAGGFESRFGDKMSSVLDIKYKEPRKFGGFAMVSLLGAEVSVESSSKDYRFTQIHGFRYRSNQYVLRGLDTEGDYKPLFMDYQGYFTYDINPELEIGLLVNYSRNKYQFVPQTRETEFGTVNEALKLTVFFEGNEIDQYEPGMGALSTTWRPRKNISLKFIGSAFLTREEETFDIEGAYRLDELERDLSSQNFGEVKFNRGIGGFIDHARNELNGQVINIQHKGFWQIDDVEVRWGARLQHEEIKDVLKEWEYQDSVGYSVPQSPGIVGWTYPNGDSTQPVPVSPRDEINLKSLVKSQNDISSNRVMGFLQAAKSWDLDTHQLTLIGGIRANHWDFNNELMVSPRASLGFKPNWKDSWTFRLAWGYYHQPAFYREMRNLYGQVNQNIKAQESIHYVLGSDYEFKMLDRPFKLTSELYYKKYNNLIPYEIDNVRIRYYATNNSNGYATGLDLKLYGQFVKGIDSWVTVGFMKTEEDLIDDYYYQYYNSDGDTIIPGYTFNSVPVDSQIFYPGFIPRPTDQRFRVGLFFQDYVPKIPALKVNLNFLYGSRLPFGPPSLDKYKDTLRMPAYRRVDIGFTYEFLEMGRKKSSTGFFRHLDNMWLSVEIFNLFGINNTISYLWVRDISDRIYGIPNFLTNRRFNVKLSANF